MSREYLIARPLLQAIEASTDGHRPVLLIDELDRADEEFEAFLLELLSDFQITIPEIGTIKALSRPIVVLTSNRTREIHDALKRRCLYHWIDYPTPAKEAEIILRKVPELEGYLAASLAEAMRRLREMELFKPPGVAETLDWAESLRLLQAGELSPATIDRTIGVVLKYKDDIDMVRSAESTAWWDEPARTDRPAEPFLGGLAQPGLHGHRGPDDRHGPRPLHGRSQSSVPGRGGLALLDGHRPRSDPVVRPRVRDLLRRLLSSGMGRPGAGRARS